MPGTEYFKDTLEEVEARSHSTYLIQPQTKLKETEKPMSDSEFKGISLAVAGFYFPTETQALHSLKILLLLIAIY